MHWLDEVAFVINMWQSGLYMVSPQQIRDAIEAWATEKTN